MLVASNAVATGVPAGARGNVVTELEEVDELDMPAPELFEALTVNVYVVAFVNPVTKMDPVELVPEPPAGEEVMVYEVAPVDKEYVTVAVVALVAVATGVPDGGKGYVIILVEAVDDAEEPEALEATTVNV